MAGERRNIVGFVHVCMINNWSEIFLEQVELMLKSGLYDKARVINVCVVGSEEQKERLDGLIGNDPRLRLGSYSLSLEDYEFHTLRYLKDTCDRGQNFYGFYIHSKGVSWPQGTRGYEGGKYWRDYMNHYIITEWKRDVEHLDLGYDLCGVKLINKRWPLHYSGNFFWFNAEYVRDVVPVNRMNLRDRFNAEMWVCSGQPIAATLCQDFVDYDTKGVFDPHPSVYRRSECPFKFCDAPEVCKTLDKCHHT